MQTQLEPHEIYSVSQLTTEARLLVEEAFQQIWIIGEISNLAAPSSGHIYFTLKDNNAQVRCACFRSSRNKLKCNPENGQQVLVLAYVSIYEPRGDFQLIVSHIELAGSGAKQIEFEKLKNKLAQEGLFDETHKKPLPEFPKKIGVVTSSTGAAVRDILIVLKRRFASIPVIIYPTLVQGDKAAPQIAQAIKKANDHNQCDVLILARGGGSLEDLWPFNEEVVARAIFASEIPIVSGIGHEIDFTIADFVADLRAPTPSAAAEAVTPDKLEWEQTLIKFIRLIRQTFLGQIKHHQNNLIHLNKRLRHPGSILRDQAQRLDQLEQSLLTAQKNILNLKKAKLEHTISKFYAVNPKRSIELYKTQIQSNKMRVTTFIQHQIKAQQQHFIHLAKALDALSPLKTLERGYAIVTDKLTNTIIRRTMDVKIGDVIEARLTEGQLECVVQGKLEISS